MPAKYPQLLLTLSVVLVALLALSGMHAYDRPTWLLEVLPVMIALPIMWATYRRFPLTTLLAICILLHAVVLIIGGTYTYARVPFGFQLADFFGLSRNPYDKIGHFFQGFVPALVAREILIRGQYIRGKRMLAFVVICIVMAISAWYELIEWGVAIAIGQDANAFLGSQGDPWDTQSDMFMAFIGATIALLAFSRLHDRQIKNLTTHH